MWWSLREESFVFRLISFFQGFAFGRLKMHDNPARSFFPRPMPRWGQILGWAKTLGLLVAVTFGPGLGKFMEHANACSPEGSVQNPSPSVGQSSASGQVQGASEELKLLPVEANLVYYVNQERTRYGLPPLQVSPRLQTSARKHCYWMARNHALVHTWEPVAENIAMGQENSKEAVWSWMNSPGHRANILGPYRWIGAAAYRATSGVIYWCLQFAR